MAWYWYPVIGFGILWGIAAFIDGWRIGGIPSDLAEKLRRERKR
jgi:hypothetical protein